MQLATLIQRYEVPFKAKYQHRLLPGQWRALAAITRCRTPASGAVVWHSATPVPSATSGVKMSRDHRFEDAGLMSGMACGCYDGVV